MRYAKQWVKPMVRCSGLCSAFCGIELHPVFPQFELCSVLSALPSFFFFLVPLLGLLGPEEHLVHLIRHPSFSSGLIFLFVSITNFGLDQYVLLLCYSCSFF